MSSKIGYWTLSESYPFYMDIYIQQSDYSLLPSKNSSWYVSSGFFILAPTNSISISTSSSDSSVGSNTFLPSTILSSNSATSAGGGPTTISSTGAGIRTSMDELGLVVLGLIGVLEIW